MALLDSSYPDTSHTEGDVFPMRLVEPVPDPEPSSDGKTLLQHCEDMQDYWADEIHAAEQRLHRAEEGLDFWAQRTDEVRFTEEALQIGHSALNG